MSSLDITPAIRARRRCVPAALVGYLVSGWLGVLPLAFLMGLIGGTVAVSSWLALLSLALFSMAVAVAVASWSAEHASRVGAVLENVFVIPFLGYLVYAIHQAGTQLDMLTAASKAASAWTMSWPVLAIGAVAAVGSLTTLSGLVAAFHYQQLIPARAAWGIRPAFTRRLHAAVLLGTSKGLLAIVHFVAASVCFIFPGALGITFVERALSASSLAPGWKSIVLFILLVIVCLEVGKRLFAKAKRLRQIQAADARRLDSRRPILLLRSFQDDLTPIERRPDVRNRRFGSMADLPLTLEEALERALWTHGPVIAIGRPGEALPPAGAAREYVTNDEWLARVTELVAECHRVVVIVGRTEGLSLEYASLARAQAWPKVVLILPPVQRAELLARWEVFAQLASRIPSGARAADLPAGALAAAFTPSGEQRFVTCQSRDDESYELAVHWLLAAQAA
jgi:hypothetical protein